MYGITYGTDDLSVDAVLSANSSDGSRRAATAVGGSAMKMQNLKVKQQLHNQTVRLREAFLRQDTRITGTIPTFMLAPCLRAGGLELDANQTKEAHWKYMTGEGRFNWLLFCDHIEKARSKTWSQASRIKSAKAFQDIDRDGSGRLSRDELEGALKRWKVPVDANKLSEMVAACDADGDGNISYPEFVDGLARDLVAPTTVWGTVQTAKKSFGGGISMPGTPRTPRTPR